MLPVIDEVCGFAKVSTKLASDSVPAPVVIVPALRNSVPTVSEKPFRSKQAGILHGDGRGGVGELVVGHQTHHIGALAAECHRRHPESLRRPAPTGWLASNVPPPTMINTVLSAVLVSRIVPAPVFLSVPLSGNIDGSSEVEVDRGRSVGDG